MFDVGLCIRQTVVNGVLLFSQLAHSVSEIGELLRLRVQLALLSIRLSIRLGRRFGISLSIRLLLCGLLSNLLPLRL